MALVNHQKLEINVKIVYFGPTGSGKTTNLKQIYTKLDPDCRGTLKAMNVQGEKMVFFDLIPPDAGKNTAYKVRYHLYTLSGEVSDPSPWKMVLKGVDGIVFVADSASEQKIANQESMKMLDKYLQDFGTNLSQIPCVIQYNKKDLANAVSGEEMQYLLNQERIPQASANARSGEGVFPTCLKLVSLINNDLQGKGLELDTRVEQLLQHEEVAPVISVSAGDNENGFSQEEPFPDDLTETPNGNENPKPVATVESLGQVSVSLSDEPLCDGNGKVCFPMKISIAGIERNFTLTVALEADSVQ
jgi:signal recognition particle receptor subunit beta